MTEEWWQCRHCGQWVAVWCPVHRHPILEPISFRINRPRHEESPTVEYYDYERRPSDPVRKRDIPR